MGSLALISGEHSKLPACLWPIWNSNEMGGGATPSLLVCCHGGRHPDKLNDRRWVAPAASQWGCYSSQCPDWRELPDISAGHHRGDAARRSNHWRACRHRRGCETNRAYHCRRPRANWRQCGSTGKCSGLWHLRDSSRKANRPIAKFCQMQKSCYVPRSKPTISVRLLHYKK